MKDDLRYITILAEIKPNNELMTELNGISLSAAHWL